MIYLITGATHTGKTKLAQELLELTHFPYLSIDHLKMGLIRSGQTGLTPMDDDKMTAYVWPIVREMIKTAIENKQNLIVEGCYIPFNWREDFDEWYMEDIRYVCLILSKGYIEEHFEDIRSHANDIEERLDDSRLNPEDLIRDNEYYLENCRKYDLPYVLVENEYSWGTII